MGTTSRLTVSQRTVTELNIYLRMLRRMLGTSWVQGASEGLHVSLQLLQVPYLCFVATAVRVDFSCSPAHGCWGSVGCGPARLYRFRLYRLLAGSVLRPGCIGCAGCFLLRMRRKRPAQQKTTCTPITRPLPRPGRYHTDRVRTVHKPGFNVCENIR